MILERLSKASCLKICCNECKQFLKEHKVDLNPPAAIIVNTFRCKKCRLKFEVDANTNRIVDVWRQVKG